MRKRPLPQFFGWKSKQITPEPRPEPEPPEPGDEIPSGPFYMNEQGQKRHTKGTMRAAD